MPHPLDASREKLARAREQLDLLEREGREYGERKPYRVIPEYDRSAGLWIGRLRQVQRSLLAQDVRVRWTLQLGELAGNLRSALDYLVYQLAAQDRAGGVHPEDPRVRTQFPIFTTTKDYRSGAKHRDRMLAGVSAEHRALIDRWQPFRRSQAQAIDRDPLTVLDWLTNRDKHRDALACELLATTADLRAHLEAPAGVPFPAGMKLRLYPARKGQWVFEEGAEVYRLIANPDASVNVQAELKVEMAFGQRRVTLERLGVVHKYVVSIIDTFIPAFGPEVL